jgi:hypothetical protein
MARPGSAGYGKDAMAKGQMRSNKEIKKPKKDKAKPAAVLVPSTSASRIQGSQDKAKGKSS